MLPIEHLNAFCVLFAQLKSVCESGADRKFSAEADEIRKKMYKHYPNLDDKMVKYLDQFTRQLITFGFSFEAMATQSKVDVSDIDSSPEVKVTGKFQYAKLVDNAPHGKIYNYNEHSVPLERLSPEEFNHIKAKTIDNIKREQVMMATGGRPKSSAQQKTWGLPDEARDW